jgi:hypothetical protein
MIKNFHLHHQLSDNNIIVNMAIAIVLGFVRDENTFNMLNFMKTKLHNLLIMHSLLLVGMKYQRFYDLQTFLYDVAYDS